MFIPMKLVIAANPIERIKPIINTYSFSISKKIMLSLVTWDII